MKTALLIIALLRDMPECGTYMLLDGREWNEVPS